MQTIGVSKKTEKPIKEKKENRKKNNRKNRIEKKPIKILKKPAGSVRFRFYKQKTEPNPNRKKTGKKPSQTKKTESKPEKPSQTGLNRFFS